MNVIEHYQVVLIFLLVGMAMVIVPMITLALIRPKKPLLAKSIPYECGKDPIGDAQVCFDLRFYTDALIFVIFDVEAAFLFPWARVFNEMKGVALVEGAIFIGILLFGLVYVWAKGDIDWVKSIDAQPGVVRREGLVPNMPESLLDKPDPAPEFEPPPSAVAAPPVAAHGHGH